MTDPTQPAFLCKQQVTVTRPPLCAPDFLKSTLHRALLGEQLRAARHHTLAAATGAVVNDSRPLQQTRQRAYEARPQP